MQAFADRPHIVPRIRSAPPSLSVALSVARRGADPHDQLSVNVLHPKTKTTLILPPPQPLRRQIIPGEIASEWRSLFHDQRASPFQTFPQLFMQNTKRVAPPHLHRRVLVLISRGLWRMPSFAETLNVAHNLAQSLSHVPGGLSDKARKHTQWSVSWKKTLDEAGVALLGGYDAMIEPKRLSSKVCIPKMLSINTPSLAEPVFLRTPGCQKRTTPSGRYRMVRPP